MCRRLYHVVVFRKVCIYLITDIPAMETVKQLIATRKSFPDYKRKQRLRWITYMEIGLGTLSIILSLSTLVISPQSILEGVLLHQGLNDYSFTHTLQGVWSGLALLVSGIVTVFAKRHSSEKILLVQITIVLATFVATFAALILSVLAAASLTSEQNVLLAAIHAVLVVFSIFGVTITFIHACVLHRNISFYSSDVTDRPSEAVVEQRFQLPEQTNSPSVANFESSYEFDGIQQRDNVIPNDHNAYYEIQSLGQRNVGLHDANV